MNDIVVIEYVRNEQNIFVNLYYLIVHVLNMNNYVYYLLKNNFYFFQIIKSHVCTHLSLIGTISTLKKHSFIISSISSVERLYCWILNFI